MALAGAFVGFTVGLTGMGGGALMTPILVLVLKVQPLAAVSSDLVAAVVMKPIGGTVHVRRGAGHRGLGGGLVLGSVPAAFAGVLLLKAMGDGSAIEDRIKVFLGVALLVAATAMVAKGFLQGRRPSTEPVAPGSLVARPGPTVAVGVLGGLVVGM